MEGTPMRRVVKVGTSLLRGTAERAMATPTLYWVS
jgi:hypothetical protein